MTARSILPCTAIAVAALVLAGCGGQGEGKEKDAADEAGPLGAFFEKAYGDWDEDAAIAQANRVEEITAECMADLGFDYTPVDQAQGFVDQGEELDVEWGTLEFAEQYGYGITTDPWSGTVDEEPVTEWVDPNQEYVEAMSETEQQAYYEALWGNPVWEDEDGEPVEYDWTQHGCQGKAQHEVYEGGAATEEFADLEEEMNAVWEGVEADPRRGELEAAWAACMADAGHSGYTRVGEPEEQLSEELNSLWEEFSPDPEATEEDWAALEKQIEEQRKALTPREMELAVADFTCREEVDYDDKQMEIAHEYEQRFVDEHKAELEAWAEAMRASRS